MIRIFLYFLASGVAALVNFSSRFFYDLFLNFWLSVIAAYFTGMLVNYLLSKKYVFSSYAGATIPKTLSKFSIIALLGLAVTTVVSILALDFFQARFAIGEPVAKAMAHCLGIGTAFVASFLGHNFLTFRATGVSRLLRERFRP